MSLARFLLSSPWFMSTSETDPPTHRILVVTGNDNFRGTLCRLLARSGYHTEFASSGEEAARRLEERAYDLVLSEIQLPGICGLTMLCNARQQGRTVPFVLLSEARTSRMRWVMSGLDAVTCLPLPLDVAELRRVLASSLQRSA